MVQYFTLNGVEKNEKNITICKASLTFNSNFQGRIRKPCQAAIERELDCLTNSFCWCFYAVLSNTGLTVIPYCAVY